MKYAQRVLVLAVAAAVGSVTGVLAQSLAELAQKEKERREAAKAAGKPAKTYGDEDLAGYSGERPAEGGSAEEAPAMSATPKTPTSTKKPPDRSAETERRPGGDRKAEAEQLRTRWREAQQRVGEAEGRLKAVEEEMKTLPPGLPAGNYIEDIRAAVEQQKVEREQRHALAKKALDAAREALDAVETEARRKQIRLE
jgi:hypothetical protein